MLPLYQERPYHDDSTASRLLSEVKHRRAQLVLRWGTTLESWVLFLPFSFFPHILLPPPSRQAACPLLILYYCSSMGLPALVHVLVLVHGPNWSSPVGNLLIAHLSSSLSVKGFPVSYD